MQPARNYYPDCPEGLIVGLARTGDKAAFTELVRRHQTPIRQLMRRLSGDPSLADDLAQQVFLKMWLKVRLLREVGAFGGWLRRLAVNVWLEHIRRHDVLAHTRPDEALTTRDKDASVGWDLDRALTDLSADERLCIVLSYQEGMSHSEIAQLTKLPLGTVKSHIRRGMAHLQHQLAAYAPEDGNQTK